MHLSPVTVVRWSCGPITQLASREQYPLEADQSLAMVASSRSAVQVGFLTKDPLTLQQLTERSALFFSILRT